MKLCVVGTGYVGLVAGTCFAESGNDVICVDKDAAKIERLNRGEIPIYEPGLGELVKRNNEEERLSFTTGIEQAIHDSLVVFIAVGTPSDARGSSDLTAVMDVATTIAHAMKSYKVIVLKSTVPVGTSRKVKALMASLTKMEFDVVNNPEFLKEGAAVVDFLKPDRVVIGTDNVRVAEIMKELYSPFVRTGKPIIVMDNESAEMTKYAANAILASRISFMNEIANLCERVGANIHHVREGIGTDSRIGSAFLFPGCGYGGSCFPKDIRALLRTGEEHDYPLGLIQAIEDANERQKQLLVSKVVAHFGQELKGRTFAIWGLAFKPKTDDMREAPALAVIEGLLQRGAAVQAYDPEAMKEARRYLGERITYSESNYGALKDADALLLLTEWNEFRRPNLDRMKGLMRHAVVFDGRDIFTPLAMREAGFTYYGIGV